MAVIIKGTPYLSHLSVSRSNPGVDLHRFPVQQLSNHRVLQVRQAAADSCDIDVYAVFGPSAQAIGSIGVQLHCTVYRILLEDSKREFEKFPLERALFRASGRVSENRKRAGSYVPPCCIFINIREIVTKTRSFESGSLYIAEQPHGHYGNPDRSGLFMAFSTHFERQL